MHCNTATEVMKRTCEVPDELWFYHRDGEDVLSFVLSAMRYPIGWADGLVTKGDGFTADRYYK